MFSDVVRGDLRSNTSIIIDVFVGLSRIFLLGILIFKRLTAGRLYKLFGVKGLKITRCYVGEALRRPSRYGHVQLMILLTK
jgi:hypothetical protein